MKPSPAPRKRRRSSCSDLVGDQHGRLARRGDEGAARRHRRLGAGQRIVAGLQRLAVLRAALAGPGVQQIVGRLAGGVQRFVGPLGGLDGDGRLEAIVFHGRRLTPVAVRKRGEKGLGWKIGEGEHCSVGLRLRR